ncbi:protein ORF151 [Cyprinid herpesvirus 3]|uniref:ORF151R n=1 Tax=Cyprinid herpesvirus 3 TaxID=180230 RepID=A3QMW6_CYHV3|nr:unnamed protein product [Cyprinid herpesvirus 3]ABC55092.1 hypothetical protein [Cyprinid herpesvirus 3]ABG42978.1 protein ORF151 [Cyprinid herpesvirus 3]AIC32506.1 ORF151R [Cyprinid herpesvirus 3]AJP55638.1 protein ORF151 [Cyprinid herpesvirus 3]AJP55793.1 protein ORF151 [Cyprinid herpesvirus 3]
MATAYSFEYRCPALYRDEGWSCHANVVLRPFAREIYALARCCNMSEEARRFGQAANPHFNHAVRVGAVLLRDDDVKKVVFAQQLHFTLQGAGPKFRGMAEVAYQLGLMDIMKITCSSEELQKLASCCLAWEEFAALLQTLVEGYYRKVCQINPRAPEVKYYDLRMYEGMLERTVQRESRGLVRLHRSRRVAMSYEDYDRNDGVMAAPGWPAVLLECTRELNKTYVSPATADVPDSDPDTSEDEDEEMEQQIDFEALGISENGRSLIASSRCGLTNEVWCAAYGVEECRVVLDRDAVANYMRHYVAPSVLEDSDSDMDS